jgi:predicted DNA-binding transcriptional regulator YafY
MFSPGRIRQLRDTGKTFERPADFRINDYLDVGFRKLRGTGPAQTVRLRFTSHAARYVAEKEWHPTQKLRTHADGSLTVTFRVNHLLEVKRWVLSFGADCQVLGPERLKQQVFQDLTETVKQLTKANELPAAAE